MQEINKQPAEQPIEESTLLFPPEKIEQDPTPNNPPWNAGQAVLLWISSVLFIMFLPFLFLIPYLMSQDVAITENPQLAEAIISDPTAISISLVATLVAHLLTLVIAWMIVTNLRSHSFTKMLGWKPGNLRLWMILALGFVGIYALAIALSALLGTHENEMTKILKSSRTAVYLVAILATFTAPLVEEVVYRGVLYSSFQKVFNVPVAVVIVTLLFAAVHVPQYSPDIATIISICTLSLLITMIRVKTDNLLPCILFHTIFNGIQSVLLIIEPYLDLPDGIEKLPEQAAPSVIHMAVVILHQIV